MIEKLRIKNFQRHERLDINFDSTVMAITGPTDTGKSSVIRALRWVAMNRPLGMSYIKDGCDRAEVAVKVDGTIVKRSRAKGENSYQIKSNGERRRFEAVGTDVPDDVQKILNLGPENFQGQHDPLFWFSLSGSEVAKSLNRIVDLTAIDEVASYLSKEVRTTKTMVEVLTRAEDAARLEVERLDFVDLLEEDYEKLSDLLKLNETLENEAKSLEEIIDRIERIQEEKEISTKAVNEAQKIIEAGDVVLSLNEEEEKLAAIIIQIGRNHALANQKVPDMDGLKESMSLFNEGNTILDGLYKIVDSITTRMGEVDTLQEKQLATEEDLTTKLDGMCPICGGEYNG